MATVNENPPIPKAEYFNVTSGATEPVWVHTEPYSNRPQFPKLEQDLEADVVVVGSGISGVQSAYELVTRGFQVVMLDARDVVSGETGRTSGHLASALDDGYVNILTKHGEEGASIAAKSHEWAIERVADIVKKHGIECEFRKLPGYEVSQYDRNKQPKEHQEEIDELKEEVKQASSLGIKVSYEEGFKVPGWVRNIPLPSRSERSDITAAHDTAVTLSCTLRLETMLTFCLLFHRMVSQISGMQRSFRIKQPSTRPNTSTLSSNG